MIQLYIPTLPSSPQAMLRRRIKVPINPYPVRYHESIRSYEREPQ